MRWLRRDPDGRAERAEGAMHGANTADGASKMRRRTDLTAGCVGERVHRSIIFSERSTATKEVKKN